MLATAWRADGDVPVDWIKHLLHLGHRRARGEPAGERGVSEGLARVGRGGPRRPQRLEDHGDVDRLLQHRAQHGRQQGSRRSRAFAVAGTVG